MLFIDSIYQADSCIIVIHHNIDGTFDSCIIVIHHNIDGTFEIATFDYIGLEFEELIIIMTLNHANNEKFSHHYFFSVWNLVLIRFVITFLFRVMHKALKKNVQIGEITIENIFSLSTQNLRLGNNNYCTILIKFIFFLLIAFFYFYLYVTYCIFVRFTSTYAVITSFIHSDDN